MLLLSTHAETTLYSCYFIFFLSKAPDSVLSVSTKDDILSVRSSSKASQSEKEESLSLPSVERDFQRSDILNLELPQSQGLPEDDSYLGLDAIDVLRKLRARLNRSTDLEAIASGIDIDGDESNLMRLYFREDDGKFLYCLPKNRAVRAGRYNPYELECVPANEAKSWPQCFTVSSTAITQV